MPSAIVPEDSLPMPSLVGLMAQQLQIPEDSTESFRILELGTRSGYTNTILRAISGDAIIQSCGFYEFGGATVQENLEINEIILANVKSAQLAVSMLVSEYFPLAQGLGATANDNFSAVPPLEFVQGLLPTDKFDRIIINGAIPPELMSPIFDRCLKDDGIAVFPAWKDDKSIHNQRLYQFKMEEYTARTFGPPVAFEVLNLKGGEGFILRPVDRIQAPSGGATPPIWTPGI